MADKEYLLGNKARDLLEYTNQATKIVTDDISRRDARKIFQKIAALDDIRDVQKFCADSIGFLDRTDLEGSTDATAKICACLQKASCVTSMQPTIRCSRPSTRNACGCLVSFSANALC